MVVRRRVASRVESAAVGVGEEVADVFGPEAGLGGGARDAASQAVVIV